MIIMAVFVSPCSSNALNPEDLHIQPLLDLDTTSLSEEMNVEEFQSGIRRLRGEAKAKDGVSSRGSSWELGMRVT